MLGAGRLPNLRPVFAALDRRVLALVHLMPAAILLGAYGTADVSELDNAASTNSAGLRSRGTLQGPPAELCVQAPAGLLAWWPGNGDTADRLGLADGVNVSVAFEPGLRGEAFRFRSILDGVHLPAQAHLEVTDFTIECWVQAIEAGVPPQPPEARFRSGVVFNANQSLFRWGVSPEGQLFVGTDFEHAVVSSSGIPDTAWHHIAVTRQGDVVTFYVDGTAAGGGNLQAGFQLQQPYALGALGALSGLGFDSLDGRVDEVAFYGRALTETEIRNLAAAGAAGHCFDDLVLGFPSPPPSRVAVGEPFTLGWLVDKRGDGTATDAALTVTLPEALTLVGVSNSTGGGFHRDGARVVVDLDALSPGSSTLIELVLRPTAEGVFTITSTVTRAQPDLATVNNSSETVITVEPLQFNVGPDIAVSETRTQDGRIPAVFEVTLSHPSASTNTVRARLVAGTAREGADFEAGSQLLVFAPGAIQVSVEAVVNDDQVHEGPETFQLVLEEPQGPSGLGRVAATCTIADNEAAPTVSVMPVEVHEGDAGPQSVGLTVRLDGESEAALTVAFATTNLTATAGIDYESSIGTVEFPPGSREATITLSVQGDTEWEPNEALALVLAPIPGRLSPRLSVGAGICTILDDEAPPATPAGFAWAPFPAPVDFADPLPVTITAVAADGTVVSNFTGTVNLSACAGTGQPASLVISEVAVDQAEDWVECMNVTPDPLDISGWTLLCYDATYWPAPRAAFQFPAGTRIPDSGVLSVAESPTPGGAYPNFRLGRSLLWGGLEQSALPLTNRPVAVLLLDADGHLQDGFFAVNAWPEEIKVPLPIPGAFWRGEPLPLLSLGNAYARFGHQNNHTATDWVMGSGMRNRTNLNLTLPFVDGRTLAVQPAVTAPFVHGRWTGEIRLVDPASPVAFIARDASGRTGRSPLIRPQVPDDLAVHFEARPTNFMFEEAGASYVATVTNPGPSTSHGVFLEVELDGALGPNVVTRAAVSQGTSRVIRGGPVEARFGDLPPQASATLTIELATLPRLVSGRTSPRLLTNLVALTRLEADPNLENNFLKHLHEIALGCRPVHPRLVAWWRAEDQASDAWGTNHAVPSAGVTYAAGRVGRGFKLAGSEAVISVPDHPSLNIGPGEPFSFETWFRLPARSGPGMLLLAAKEQPAGDGADTNRVGWALFVEDGRLGVRVSDSDPATPPAELHRKTTPDLRDGAWHHVVLIWRGNGGYGGAFLDGEQVLAATPAPENGDLANDAPLQFGGGDWPSGWEMDEPGFYRVALIESQVTPLYGTGVFGKCPYALRLESLTETVISATAGRPVTLLMRVSNSGPETPDVHLEGNSSALPFTEARLSSGAAVISPAGTELTADLGPLTPRQYTTLAVTFAATNSPASVNAAFTVRTESGAGTASANYAITFMPDEDHDRIPDGWELEHGLRADFPGDAQEDKDGDGLDNLGEYEAGTLPEDPTSAPRLSLTVLPEPEAIRLEFNTLAGRTYRVERAARLGSDADWTPVGTEVVGNYLRAAVDDALPTADSGAYYRLRVTFLR